MTEAADRDQAHDAEGGHDYRSRLDGYLESLFGKEAYGEVRDSYHDPPEYCALAASLAG